MFRVTTAQDAFSAPTAWSTALEPASPKYTGKSFARAFETASAETSRATNGMSCSLSSSPIMFPTRPYPAMMTWPDKSLASPSFACSDATDFSSLKNLLNSAPRVANRGVAAIVSTTARLIWFTIAMGSKPAAAAMP